jgi:hypothetical protein
LIIKSDIFNLIVVWCEYENNSCHWVEE